MQGPNLARLKPNDRRAVEAFVEALRRDLDTRLLLLALFGSKARGDDLPDAETWDAILIEKELVAWMAVHFDCKKWLAKKIKGMHPFDLCPRGAPYYDLSGAQLPSATTVSRTDER